MNKLDEKINSYKKDAYDFLDRLIACPSVLDEYRENSDIPFGVANKEALETLITQGKKDGFLTGNVDNYAGWLEFGEGKQTLGVLAHLDVVPVTESEWDSNPFKMDVRDGKIFGRGSLDDKGPLVASYIAMRILKDEGFKPNKKIRLIAGCDEESGSRCLERYLEKCGEPDIAFSPDAGFPVIYGEKAILSYDIVGDLKDDVIVTMAAGQRYNIVPSKATMTLSVDLKNEYIKFLNDNNYKGELDGNTYVAYGVATHASTPDEGVNAIYILFEFLAKYSTSKLAKFIEKYYLWDNNGKKAGYYDSDPLMLELTSNMAIADIKDGKIKLGVNCRCPKDDSFTDIPNALAKITNEFGYSYEFLGGSKRHYVSPESELVVKLLKAFRDVTGDMSDPITIGGGTYAREMKNAVAYGPVRPGQPDLCHVANECIEESDFINAIKIYYLAIKELTQ